MDKCSYFITNKALFGSYPDNEQVKILEQEGVIFFVNLTNPNESKISPYNTNFTEISFPIKDNYIPDNIQKFSKLIYMLIQIINNLKENEKIYIHCKGGHGRSGIVVACLIVHIFSLDPVCSMKYTSRCHNNRQEMKNKWRKLGSPQTHEQKNFVLETCNKIIIKKTDILSLYYEQDIIIKNIKFKTVNNAIQHLIKVDKIDFKNACEKILKLKVKTCDIFKKKLIETCLHQIIVEDENEQKSIYTSEILILLRFDIYVKSYDI